MSLSLEMALNARTLDRLRGKNVDMTKWQIAIVRRCHWLNSSHGVLSASTNVTVVVRRECILEEIM